ncbi:MAG: hypothetical protein LBQ48_00695 [Oscillospiraceae bacterium]|nr:hypothetical protein [Oscillospiraceae bacterium]
MICVIDRTLSCLDHFSPTPKQLLKLTGLLVEAAADWIELSETAFLSMQTLPKGGKYILRLKTQENRSKYPMFERFVCRELSQSESGKQVTAEITMNSIHESYTLAKYREYGLIRVRGMDDILLENFDSAFGRLRKIFSGGIELCPTNRFGCASAIATEWALADRGTSVVTSLCGIGGFAAFEEVVMALRYARLRKVGKNYPMFPAIGRLMEEIPGIKIPGNKPILGNGIFAVESGIHVDGIVKQPKSYAPFPPEDIGQKHTIVLGKQSGKGSIIYKLQERNLRMTRDEILRLLISVKKFSIKKNRAITDGEFVVLAEEVLAGRGCAT